MKNRKNKLTLNRFEFSALLALLFVIISLAVGSMTDFASNCKNIRDNTIRLHVIANSDSAEDQQIKLAVRDAVLEQYSALLRGQSKTDALENTSALLDEIELTANRLLAEQNINCSARAELVEMYFATTEYGEFTMPAGRYDALRITIGEAKGHNWWCVMFPPLCLPAATSGDALITDTELYRQFGRTSAELVKSAPKYEVRFALLEFFQRLIYKTK
ncbi:MAG: stage II sporulation protein R [Oscillospiraceae bacterium]|nr:stage II sporulation protein R [Oscillospiraceae bacterium]